MVNVITTDGYPQDTPPSEEAVAVDEPLLCGRRTMPQLNLHATYVCTALVVRDGLTELKATQSPHSYSSVLQHFSDFITHASITALLPVERVASIGTEWWAGKPGLCTCSLRSGGRSSNSLATFSSR
jgi:hypothetical protein